jgi:hypothetical protein
MKPSHEQSAVSMNRSMPHSVVISVLAYPEVREAVDWLRSLVRIRWAIADRRSQVSAFLRFRVGHCHRQRVNF